MHIRNLFNKLGTTLYVLIWENRIKVTDVNTRNVFDDKPLVAIGTNSKGKQVIAAVGNSAAMKSVKEMKVINPFSHPRVLFSDFAVGEKLLQHILYTLLGKRLLSISPAMVIHPMEKTEEGLTGIEIRAFRELAHGAGARDAVVYQGDEIPLAELDFDDIKLRVGVQ